MPHVRHARRSGPSFSARQPSTQKHRQKQKSQHLTDLSASSESEAGGAAPLDRASALLKLALTSDAWARLDTLQKATRAGVGKVGGYYSRAEAARGCVDNMSTTTTDVPLVVFCGVAGQEGAFGFTKLTKTCMFETNGTAGQRQHSHTKSNAPLNTEVLLL